MPKSWKRILHCTLALAAALVLLPASSRGQSYTGSYWGPSWELTAFNGYYVASDLYTALNSHIGLENSYTWGGRLGFYPNPRGGIEFSYTRSGSELQVNDGPLVPPGGLGRVNLDNYDVNFVLQQENMANPRVSGFFTFGFGWTLTNPEITGSGVVGQPQPDGETFFAWNMGLGTKIGMSEAIALRLEGRWRITDTNFTTSSGVYCDYWGYCYGYASDWYSSGEFSAGLTFKMGSR